MYHLIKIVVLTFVLMLVAPIANSTNVKIGKYRLGVNYTPLQACVIWTNNDGTYQYRYANATEFVNLSNKVSGKSVTDAVTTLESISVTRTLTSEEILFCDDILKVDLAQNVKRVAVNPRYPDNKTRPVKTILPDGSLGDIVKTKPVTRAVVGSECGKLIKYVNSRYSYYTININNVNYGVYCE